MKKLASIILCCLLAFGLIGCGSSTKVTASKEETKTTTDDSKVKDSTLKDVIIKNL